MKLQHSLKNILEAGTDEAGRGCLAGPVTAAAVILPPDFKNEVLNDSKQLTEKQRYALRPIIEKEALAWAVAHVGPEEIDEINILNASILAMHRAMEQLSIQPEFIAVDGNRFKPFGQVPHHCQVKGDATYMNIAAASVLAKTYRDDVMKELANQFPQYAWERNAGYPTKAHRDAIRAHGATPHHRKSFQLLPSQLNLFDL
ncbi:MAG: hypothetical protein RL754_1314 [Bacteroidota bacterium]|jgi:ribonuclease HII